MALLGVQVRDDLLRDDLSPARKTAGRTSAITMRPGWLAQAAFFYGPPEVCGKTLVCGPRLPSAAKAAIDFAALTARLKPCPFKAKSRPEFFRSLLGLLSVKYAANLPL
jgi:hypothetical protein